MVQLGRVHFLASLFLKGKLMVNSSGQGRSYQKSAKLNDLLSKRKPKVYSHFGNLSKSTQVLYVLEKNTIEKENTIFS